MSAGASASALLAVRDVSRSFGRQAALQGVSFDVGPGEFIALLGPSGCGKTTLLRCIAGLDTCDSGTIAIDGGDVTKVPAYRRPLNTVFQSYALFPHLSVLENVAYGPRRAGVGRGPARRSAGEALELVGLAGFGERSPRQLSGGQQQRVALARAIVNRPKLLLLDEPLSALDLKLRKRMQVELKQLQARLGIAFVLVTHDQEEALGMADRVVVMNHGRIEQIGTGAAVYATPATRFVADFIGEANLLACTPDGDGGLRPAIGTRTLLHAGDPGRRYHAVLRPEQVEIADGAPREGLSVAPGVVEDVLDVGSHVTVLARVDGVLVVARPERRPATPPVRGAPIVLAFDPARLHVIAE